jgi:hypothetical protein
VVRGHGVQDEIEAAGVLLHLVHISGDHNFVGAKPQCVLSLAGGCGEDDHVGSEGAGELHAHVAQPTQAHDPDLLALGDAPVPQR